MGFFPYPYRAHQREAAEVVSRTVAAGGHAIIEAPTGTGKTVTLLAGALEPAQKAGHAIVYVTRTNSQQAQAVAEARAIAVSSGLPLRLHALQGRNHLCLKLEDLDDPQWRGASPDELSHYCRHAKRLADEDAQDPKACRYWARLTDLDDAALAAAVGPNPLRADEAKDVARAAGFCPYEATKRLLAGADVVIAPYIYVFEPNLRRRLLEWMQRRPDEVVLIVDEAHNLPDYLRSLFSPRLTRRRLRLALKEAGQLGDPAVLDGVTASELLTALATALDACVDRFSVEEDGFLPPFELEARLMERFRTATPKLLEAGRNLGVLGEAIKDQKRLRGRIPRSQLSGVAGFLEAWFGQDEEVSLKLVGREPENYLESFLVDTTRVTGFLTELAATVHASGTLEPLEEYHATLGLPAGTTRHVAPSPWGPEGLTLVATRGLTTRYESLKQDPRLADRLQDAVRSLVAATPVKTAVFFPSHDLHQQFLEVGVFADLPTPAVHETRGMPQDDLVQMIAAHRTRRGPGVITGVLGGRLSEGIDYPGRDLEAIVVVGTPYPKPTAHQRALFQWAERRTGNGWEFTVTAPALRRLRQAIGRIRRGPDDQGLVVLVDERSAPLLRRAGMAVELVEPAAAVARLASWSADDTLKSDASLER